ncbi:MAG TPA: type II toxin-antitoxin system RelE/ParE family toxin [Burkholderiales bacterium]|nr:type II toxin-antitoxin system RelE/ParE family toxin [Burkholderiales bacterium]
MLFIETSAFSALLEDWLSDEEYRGLQSYLMERPDAGDIIRGSGGIRKVRWAAKGKGKSGGVRVIYYWAKAPEQIYLLTMYGKSERTDIDRATLKRIAAKLELLDK